MPQVTCQNSHKGLAHKMSCQRSPYYILIASTSRNKLRVRLGVELSLPARLSQDSLTSRTEF